MLQNSFWITEDNFSGLWARRSNNRVGDHSNSQKRSFVGNPVMFDERPSSDIWNRLARGGLQGIDYAATGRLHEHTDVLDRAVSVEHGEEGVTGESEDYIDGVFPAARRRFFLGYLADKDLDGISSAFIPLN